MSEKRPGIWKVREWLALQADPVVVDIGAHVGKISRMCLDANPDAIVHAIEPVHANWVALQADKRITAWHGAIGRACEMREIGVPYQKHKDRSQSCTFNMKVLKRKKNTGRIDIIKYETVQVLTLDAYVKQAQINHIDLLKLNCEGSEYEILAEPFPVPVRSVFVSWHDDQDKGRKEQCTEVLRKQGLRSFSTVSKRDHTWEFWRSDA